MVPDISRRNAIAAASMSLVSLSGCTFLNGDTQTATIHLINNTSSEQDFYTELTYDDNKHQFGKITTIPAGSAIEVNVDVSQRTYIIKTNVDDIEPRPEQTTKLETTQNECKNSIYFILYSSGEKYNLRYVEPKCQSGS